MNKKGLSPVIATALLIVIALVLAVIIYLWARSFLAERNIKFGEVVENSCGNIVFDADASARGSEVGIVNRGNVPLYNFEIYKISASSRELLSVGDCGSGTTLNPGNSCSIAVTDGILSSGDELAIIPVILGEKGSARTPYSCKDSGKQISVGA